MPVRPGLKYGGVCFVPPGSPPALPNFTKHLADVPFRVGLAQAVFDVAIDAKKAHGL